MTSKHRRLERPLAVLASLLLFAGCDFSNDPGGTAGAAGTTGGSGSSGGSGTGGPAGTTGTGGGSGTGGAGGTVGSNDGGTDAGGTTGGGGTGGDGTITCPTNPAPGNCEAPADIHCPYPKLSQTGCIAANPTSDTKVFVKMASSVVPYEVNSPLWSDGAFKSRGMKLPTGGKIHVKDCAKNPAECQVNDPATGKCCAPTADDGKWVFPVGTVLVKNFAFPDASRPSGYKVVETRLLIRLDHTEDVEGVKTDWIGYGYKWDDAQTDATIIGNLSTGFDDGSDTGVTAKFNVKPTASAATQEITWSYPSRLDCITCHMPITPKTTPTSGYSIGPETIQMNRVVAGDAMNQIDKFAAANMFDVAPSKPYKAALVAPYAGQAGSPPAGATLEQRARSYLHANCSFCHRPDGKWNGFDVRYDVPFKNTNLCNSDPNKGNLGVDGAKILTPMNPGSSVMYLRMHAPPTTATSGNTGRMPQIGSSVIDTEGTKLISDWITSITACPQ